MPDGDETQHAKAQGAEEAHGDVRPEEWVEQWGRRVGRFLASAAARAREEAEDIIAEAQSIRRGERE